MKVNLLFLAMIFSLVSFGQKKGSAILFAYKQAVLGGAKPEIIIELDGEHSESTVTGNYNYFIFLKSTSRLYPVEMWISGKPYSVSVESISTPVEFENHIVPNSPKKVLVPRTNDKVISLTPTTYVSSKKMEVAKDLALKNEFVVVYKLNGTFYYSVKKKFDALEVAAMQ